MKKIWKRNEKEIARDGKRRLDMTRDDNIWQEMARDGKRRLEMTSDDNIWQEIKGDAKWFWQKQCRHEFDISS